MANIELRHLKSFMVLAVKEHFGKAAETLNTTQPQLSRTLKHIEAEVGVSLIDRTTRQFSLTLAGEKFLELARKTLRQSEEIVLHTRMVGDGDLGTIRIGYMDFAINRSVPRFLRAFQMEKPSVKVLLDHQCTEKQHRSLLENELDIGFLIGPFIHDEIQTEQVSSRRLMAILPDTHPMATRADVSLKELSCEGFIMGQMEDWRPFREHVERECMSSGFVPRVIHEPFNSDGIFGLVAAGLGITVYPERAARLNPRGVVMKPIRDVEKSVQVIAAWRKNNPSKILSEFVNIVRHRVTSP